MRPQIEKWYANHLVTILWNELSKRVKAYSVYSVCRPDWCDLQLNRCSSFSQRGRYWRALYV
ncbi:hypothetical protein KDI_47350 [Dictyobacter arantiisoli]|uniref:Uncharacterized protein n=1 Tax=Dictyobacter arantiisoli TaxID=2014874 RepID=A0A5A5THV4_9CHLR|nr:hypothetical protein KDI_47350 [Dictyobacter arantiisoli]